MPLQRLELLLERRRRRAGVGPRTRDHVRRAIADGFDDLLGRSRANRDGDREVTLVTPPRTQLVTESIESAGDLVERPAGHHVAVTDARGPAERRLRFPADEDRDSRRHRFHQQRAEVEETAVVLDRALLPESPHRLDHLVRPGAAGVEVDAHGLELLALPADADAEDQAAARDARHSRGGLGEDDWVPHRQHEHTRHEADPVRDL